MSFVLVSYLFYFASITYVIFCLKDFYYAPRLQILQLPAILQNTNETFECFVIIVGSVLTIYINFYIGQMLIDHNTAVFYEL